VTVKVQLLGRGTYGPHVVQGRGISPLWSYFLPPPAQNSILIYDDGTVVERATFENDDTLADDVHTFILGGTDFRTEVGSFDYNALTAAGYTWRNVYTENVYPEDYDSPYNAYNTTYSEE
jgi:hypothetical protein